MVDRLRSMASALRRSLSPQAYFNPQDFSELPHRRSLGGHRTFLPLTTKQRRTPCRDSFATARAAKSPQGGWPTSIRMGGRIPAKRVAGLVQITQSIRAPSRLVSPGEPRDPSPAIESAPDSGVPYRAFHYWLVAVGSARIGFAVLAMSRAKRAAGDAINWRGNPLNPSINPGRRGADR